MVKKVDMKEMVNKDLMEAVRRCLLEEGGLVALPRQLGMENTHSGFPFQGPPTPTATPDGNYRQ